MNDHGSHAQVGDYVRMASPAGMLTECRGIVYKIERGGNTGNRYLYVHGMDTRIKDSYCRIISRAQG